MSKILSKLVFGISITSVIGLYCLTLAPSASAAQDKSTQTKGTDKAASDKAASDKAASDKAASDKAASDKAAADKAASDKAASDKAASDKAAADKAASDKAASDKAASDKAASDKAAADKAASDKAAADKAASDKAASDKAASDKAAADKAASDKAASDKAAAETTTKNAKNGGSTSSRPVSIIDFGFGDIGKTFQFNFDGNVATQKVDGLSSTALFTLKDFTGNQAIFDVALDNTSSNGIKSRTSALGFNVYSELKSTNKLDFNASIASGGLFSNTVKDGAFPNQFGDIDVCFTDGKTCQGGQNGGVSTDDNIRKFSFTLAFQNAVKSFALGNLGVRYQSIEGTSLGSSGTGHGQYYQAPPAPPRKVPEPSATASLGLLAVGALIALKKKTLKQD